MNDYRDRVRQERADLYEKLTKLEKYMEMNENARRDSLLKSQAATMRDYVAILDHRIAAFPEGPVVQAADLIAAGKAAEPAGLSQIDDVTVTVSAPPGKRAVVVRYYDGDNELRQTVTQGQNHIFTLAGDDVLCVNEGQPHGVVADNTSAR